MFGGRKKKAEASSKKLKFAKLLPPTHIQKVGTIMELEVACEETKEEIKFVWEKPSYTSGEGERIHFITEGFRSLCRVSPVQIQDEGDWRCTIKSKKHRSDETVCGLVIYVPKSYRIPTFLEELEAKVSKDGTVALECKVIGVPTPKLLWFKDDKELNAGDSYELRAENNKPTTTYKCVAVNCIGSAMSETILKITSSANTAPPKLLVGMNDIKVKIGSDIEFFVKVEWLHNNKAVVSTPKRLMIEEANVFKLQLRSVELNDDGEWGCKVSNDLGSFLDQCKVTMKVPKNYRKPVFVEKLRANLTDEGLVSFECKVIGFPTPALTWLKDGQELRPGDVYQLYGSQSIGVYTCLARNCMGEAKSTSALTLEDLENKPKKSVEIIVPLKNIEVKYGDPCQLSVQVSSPLQLPYTWRKNGVEIGFPDYIIGCEEDGKYFCNIPNVDRADEGSWEVLLESGDDMLSSFCVLKVVIPKHFKAPKFLENLRVFLGENGNVSLECKVIGIPQPKLTWFKDDQELRAGDLHQLTSGKGSDGKLDPKACVFGKYCCVAENCMGKSSSEATLIGFGDDVGDEVSAHQSIIDSISSNSPQKDIIEEIDVSASLGKNEKSVMLSISDVPDISAENAQQIVEMFAQELSESISDSNIVELPPLRFVRESSKSDKVQMEAVVIDIDEQGLEEAERMASTMEDVDEETVADVDDIFSSGEPEIELDHDDMFDVEVIEDMDNEKSIKRLMERTIKSEELSAKESNVNQEKKTSGQDEDKVDAKVPDILQEEIIDITETSDDLNMSHVNKNLWQMVKEAAQEQVDDTDRQQEDDDKLEKINLNRAKEEVAELEDIITKANIDDHEAAGSDSDEEEERIRRRRRSSSYEDTIKNMDPELLKELGLMDNDDTSVDSKEKNTSTDKATDLATRVEEKAQELIKDVVPATARRSRSRSRSRSKPPNLDTVEENYSAEYQEALYYKKQLEDIKESSSCSSVPSQVTQSPSESSVIEMIKREVEARPEELDIQLAEQLLQLERQSLEAESPTRGADDIHPEIFDKLIKRGNEEVPPSKSIKSQDKIGELKKDLMLQGKSETMLVEMLAKTMEALQNPEDAVQELQLLQQGKHIQELQGMQKPKLGSRRPSADNLSNVSSEDKELLSVVQSELLPLLEISNMQKEPKYIQIGQELLKDIEDTDDSGGKSGSLEHQLQQLLELEHMQETPLPAKGKVIQMQQDIALTVQSQLVQREDRKLRHQEEKLIEDLSKLSEIKRSASDVDLHQIQALEEKIEHHLKDVKGLREPVNTLIEDINESKDKLMNQSSSLQDLGDPKAAMKHQANFEHQLIQFQKFRDIKKRRKELNEEQVKLDHEIESEVLQQDAPKLGNKSDDDNDDQSTAKSKENGTVKQKHLQNLEVEELEQSFKKFNDDEVAFQPNEAKSDSPPDLKPLSGPEAGQGQAKHNKEPSKDPLEVIYATVKKKALKTDEKGKAIIELTAKNDQLCHLDQKSRVVDLESNKIENEGLSVEDQKDKKGDATSGQSMSDQQILASETRTMEDCKAQEQTQIIPEQELDAEISTTKTDAKVNETIDAISPQDTDPSQKMDGKLMKRSEHIGTSNVMKEDVATKAKLDDCQERTDTNDSHVTKFKGPSETEPGKNVDKEAKKENLDLASKAQEEKNVIHSQPVLDEISKELVTQETDSDQCSATFDKTNESKTMSSSNNDESQLAQNISKESSDKAQSTSNIDSGKDIKTLSPPRLEAQSQESRMENNDITSSKIQLESTKQGTIEEGVKQERAQEAKIQGTNHQAEEMPSKALNDAKATDVSVKNAISGDEKQEQQPSSSVVETKEEKTILIPDDLSKKNNQKTEDDFDQVASDTHGQGLEMVDTDKLTPKEELNCRPKNESQDDGYNKIHSQNDMQLSPHKVDTNTRENLVHDEDVKRDKAQESKALETIHQEVDAPLNVKNNVQLSKETNFIQKPNEQPSNSVVEAKDKNTFLNAEKNQRQNDSPQTIQQLGKDEDFAKVATDNHGQGIETEQLKQQQAPGSGAKNVPKEQILRIDPSLESKDDGNNKTHSEKDKARESKAPEEVDASSNEKNNVQLSKETKVIHKTSEQPSSSVVEANDESTNLHAEKTQKQIDNSEEILQSREVKDFDKVASDPHGQGIKTEQLKPKEELNCGARNEQILRIDPSKDDGYDKLYSENDIMLSPQKLDTNSPESQKEDEDVQRGKDQESNALETNRQELEASSNEKNNVQPSKETKCIQKTSEQPSNRVVEATDKNTSLHTEKTQMQIDKSEEILQSREVASDPHGQGIKTEQLKPKEELNCEARNEQILRIDTSKDDDYNKIHSEKDKAQESKALEATRQEVEASSNEKNIVQLSEETKFIQKSNEQPYDSVVEAKDENTSLFKNVQAEKTQGQNDSFEEIQLLREIASDTHGQGIETEQLQSKKALARKEEHVLRIDPSQDSHDKNVNHEPRQIDSTQHETQTPTLMESAEKLQPTTESVEISIKDNEIHTSIKNASKLDSSDTKKAQNQEQDRRASLKHENEKLTMLESTDFEPQASPKSEMQTSESQGLQDQIMTTQGSCQAQIDSCDITSKGPQVNNSPTFVDGTDGEELSTSSEAQGKLEAALLNQDMGDHSQIVSNKLATKNHVIDINRGEAEGTDNHHKASESQIAPTEGEAQALEIEPQDRKAKPNSADLTPEMMQVSTKKNVRVNVSQEGKINVQGQDPDELLEPLESLPPQRKEKNVPKPESGDVDFGSTAKNQLDSSATLNQHSTENLMISPDLSQSRESVQEDVDDDDDSDSVASVIHVPTLKAAESDQHGSTPTPKDAVSSESADNREHSTLSQECETRQSSEPELVKLGDAIDKTNADLSKINDTKSDAKDETFAPETVKSTGEEQKQEPEKGLKAKLSKKANKMKSFFKGKDKSKDQVTKEAKQQKQNKEIGNVEPSGSQGNTSDSKSVKGRDRSSSRDGKPGVLRQDSITSKVEFIPLEVDKSLSMTKASTNLDGIPENRKAQHDPDVAATNDGDDAKPPPASKQPRRRSRSRHKSPEVTKNEAFDKHLMEMKKSLQKLPDQNDANGGRKKSLTKSDSFKNDPKLKVLKEEIKTEVITDQDSLVQSKIVQDTEKDEIEPSKVQQPPPISETIEETTKADEHENNYEIQSTSISNQVGPESIPKDENRESEPKEDQTTTKDAEISLRVEKTIDPHHQPLPLSSVSISSEPLLDTPEKQPQKLDTSSNVEICIPQVDTGPKTVTGSLSFLSGLTKIPEDSEVKVDSSRQAVQVPKEIKSDIRQAPIAITVTKAPEEQRSKHLDSQEPATSDDEAVVHVREVGTDWVSLSWKRPDGKMKMPPIVTYKVEAWLCGEGAYWVEVGRSPITQFDAFNLKPNRQYYFRVTAKSRRGVEFELMTKGKVDLSKSTEMPKFTKQMPNYLRILEGQPLALSCEFSGEPLPEAKWNHTLHRPKPIAFKKEKVIPQENSKDERIITSINVDVMREKDAGKYSCDITNISGRASNFCYVDIVKDERVFKSYERAKTILDNASAALKEETFPCFLVSPRDRRIEHGCPIQFMCRPIGNPAPTVKWYRDGKEMTESEDIHQSAKDGYFYLSFDFVTDKDSGQYEAIASNDIGQVQSRFLLVVDEGCEEHFGPQFVSPLTNQEGIPVNQSVLLQTKVSASPYVALNWYRNGCKIRQSSKVHKYFDKDGNASLALVGNDCSGMYTCIAFNEGGENTISVNVPIQEKQVDDKKVFKVPPRVEQKGESLVISCQLVNAGDVFLSTIPKLDSKQRAFTRGSNNSHTLELVESNAKDQEFCSKLVYVIVRGGVQGVICPIYTDIERKAKKFPLLQSLSKRFKAKKVQNASEKPLEAFCKSGDEMALGLGKLLGSSPGQDTTVTLTKIDEGNLASRPTFSLNQDEFEVLFKRVNREDEGIYEVKVAEKDGSIRKFNYVLVVLDKLEHDISSLVETSDLDCDTPYFASKVSRGPTPLRHLTPHRTTPRTTPVRAVSPTEEQDRVREREKLQFKKSHINPRIISGLSDLNSAPGENGEIKCYLLTIPGLETRWEKDGRPLDVNDTRVRTFESRGVRGMSIRNLRESDSGIYSVRVMGRATNLFSQCRISVAGRSASTISPALMLERAKRGSYFGSYRRNKYSSQFY